jgi:hypothetical protein
VSAAAVQLDLAPEKPAWARTWGTLTERQRREQRTRWIDLLTPITIALAKRRGPEGITASEVTSEAILCGYLWGEAAFFERYPRVYAWIGPWLGQLARRGHLVPKVIPIPGGQLQVSRKSERGASHRNRNAVYLHPEFARRG